MKQVFICSSNYYYCEKPAWDVKSHTWHVKVLDWFVREFKLSHSNVVNRIIGYKNFSCTPIAREDVKTFPLLQIVQERTHIVYKIT